MELNWFQSILLGFFSGLAEILPVSAEAHRLVLLHFFGDGSDPLLLQLFLHMAILAGLYYCCYNHILRITRARKLARIPKQRRRRPLDTRSMMDFSLLKTMLIPVIAAFFFYQKTEAMGKNLVLIAVFLFINGIILYIPQHLPGSNKDSRSLSRLDGLLIGLGGAVSTIPGISCVGAGVSVATACGADKNYALSMSLLMAILVTIGYIAFDVMALMAAPIALSFGMIINCLLAAAAAFAGVFIGIRVLRVVVSNFSMSLFSFYCWGMALLTFILYLTAA